MSPVASLSRVVPLPWDSRHFGFPIGRLEGGTEGLEAALAEADAARIRLLVARVEVSELEEVERLEEHGFRLADTLVRYARELPPGPGEAHTELRIRPAAPGDAGEVERLAAEAFEGYPGHFRNDHRLDPRLADLVYVRWAVSACREPESGSRMFVVELEGRPAGFGLVSRAAADTAEGALYGVGRSARGRGAGLALLQATMQWAAANGFGRMVVYSSAANPPPHRVWLRGGLLPGGGLHTLHRWRDGTRR